MAFHSAYSAFFRSISLLTLLLFMPSGVQAWNFLPLESYSTSSAEKSISIPYLTDSQIHELEIEHPDELVLLNAGQEHSLATGGKPNSVEPGQGARENLAKLPDVSGPVISDAKPAVKEDQDPLDGHRVDESPENTWKGYSALDLNRHIAEVQYQTAAPEDSSPLQLAKSSQDNLLVTAVATLTTPGQTDLSNRLAEADTLRNSGDLSGAYNAYIELLDTYPRRDLAEVEAALANINVIVKAASQEELDLILVNAPSFARLATAFAKVYRLGLGSERALRRQSSGDTVGAAEDLRSVQVSAWEIVEQYPNDMINRKAVLAFVLASEQLGETDSARQNALNFAASSPSSVATFSLWNHFAEQAANQGDFNNARLWYANMLEVFHDGVLDSVLADGRVNRSTRLQFELALAYGDYLLGNLETAQTQYRSIVSRYTPLPPERKGGQDGVYSAGLHDATITARLHPMDPYEGVLAYYEYLQHFPESPRAPEAILGIAGLYLLAGDYDQAANYYAQAAQAGKDTPTGELAEHELEFVLRNFSGTVQVARGELPEDKDTSQWCGPFALAKLLNLKGIHATPAELAGLAGTDAHGTTMFGLAEASAAKGLALTGVQESNLSALPVPFLALVNDNHYVVVREIVGDTIAVSDMGNTETLVSLTNFTDTWNGKALVSGGEKVAHALEPELMRLAKGGVGGPPPPTATSAGLPNAGWGDGGGGGGGSEPPVDGIYQGRVNACNGSRGYSTGAISSTGIQVPGVHVDINTFLTALVLEETDLQIDVLGPMSMLFKRVYVNEKGFHRTEYQGTTKPWKNILGDGWTHNLNVHLRTSTGTPPTTVVLYGPDGAGRTYNLDSTSGGYNYYVRASDRTTGEIAHTLKRDTTTLKYTLELPNGLQYEFSAATTDSDRFARLEAIKDTSANQISLSYSGAVGTGKLTKVTSPSGDAQHIILSYASNLITKAEFKESSTVLKTVTYAYASDELTSVTDPGGSTVTYAYGSTGGVSGSRYITKITDRMGREANFAWAYTGGEAYRVSMTGPNALVNKYERSVSTAVCTATALDGGTELARSVNTPLAGETTRTRYQDTYLNGGTYERRSFEYDSSKNLTKVLRPSNAINATYTYTARGRLSIAGINSGAYIRYQFDAGGLNPTRITNMTGLDSTMAYDNVNRLTHATAPGTGGAGTTMSYTATGLVTAITNPLSQSVSMGYDGLGRNTSVSNPLSSTISFAYDALGNNTAVTDPLNRTTYQYYASDGCGCGGSGSVTKVEDVYGNETFFEYDRNGNMTRNVNASSVSSDYFYDDMNRLTRITAPSGSGKDTDYAYSLLGEMTDMTDVRGIASTYTYDRYCRVTLASDPAGDMTQVYDSAGDLSVAIDGTGGERNYDYDGNRRLTQVTDDGGKVIKRFYDSAGRLTKIGAGGSGTIDPTEYFYDGVTGLMTKVGYTDAASSTQYVTYAYDSLARQTKIVDWMSGGTANGGISYFYDGAGRMTRTTDYSGDDLTYTYDAAGNVLTMVDYHGNTTTYAYDVGDQLLTMNAPGGKTWITAYNAVGQPASEKLPNGMATFYAYDSENVLTKIDHRDAISSGSTVLSYEYERDDNANITRSKMNDGSFWEYGYDAKARLTRGDLTTDWGHVAKYRYTYDAADNMVTKQEPFAENWNDVNLTGWTVSSAPTWSATNGYVENAVNTSNNPYLRKDNVFQADAEIRFSYYSTNTSNNNYYLRAAVRVDTGTGERLEVRFFPNKANIVQSNGVTVSTLDSDNTVTTAQDTWYDVVIKLDGSDVSVSRSVRGGTLAEVLSTTSTTTVTTNRLEFLCSNSAQFRLDGMMVIDGAASSIWAMTANSDHELTQMACSAQGTTETYAYDAWGRMTRKTLGAKDAEYAYNYGGMLTKVTSDQYDEGDVTYEYSGDRRRLSRVTVDDAIRYHLDKGGAVLSEEHADSDLDKSYVYNPMRQDRATYAQVKDLDASEDGEYALHGTTGSPEALYDENKSILASYQFNPYGSMFRGSNSDATNHLFGGLEWDARAAMYFTPARFYSPLTSRWMMEEPLGLEGPNLYGYCLSDPVNKFDVTGLQSSDNSPWFDFSVVKCRAGATVRLLGKFFGLFFLVAISQFAGLMLISDCVAAVGVTGITVIGAAVIGTFCSAVLLALAGVVFWSVVTWGKTAISDFFEEWLHCGTLSSRSDVAARFAFYYETIN